MVDPLAEVVTLLQPGAPFSKLIGGAGVWRIHCSEVGQPLYCVVLEGACRLAVKGQQPLSLQQGDFILIPSLFGFTMSSLTPPGNELSDSTPGTWLDGEFRFGISSGPPDVQLLVGHCVFGSPDAALLVSLLPRLITVRGEQRFATLVQLLAEESRARRPARDVILARLLEVLLIEALRTTGETSASPGLLRGLADDRLAVAIRRMHENPTRPWKVAELAKEAALSRSTFFERFSRAVGITPMEYLLAWRMALAKKLLLDKEYSINDVAARVGYSSASAFSVAFTRYVGVPPTGYAQRAMAAPAAADDEAVLPAVFSNQ